MEGQRRVDDNQTSIGLFLLAAVVFLVCAVIGFIHLIGHITSSLTGENAIPLSEQAGGELG